MPVLIASWLDQRHADRISAAEPDRIELLYEPRLLPTTRYLNDHHGPPRALSAADRECWRGLLARAEVSFDLDWEQPAEMLARAPNLRWVQASSSGVGPTLLRLGLAGSHVVVTNAAGVHAQPLAEFVLMAALHFAKGMPELQQWKAERHWELHSGRELAGSRMLLVGLGGMGARIAALSSAIGVEVIGWRRTAGGPPPPGVKRLIDSAEIDAELPTTDLLVLAAPETPDTVNLIDRRRLELLPPSAVFINVGRGSLVDETALVDQLVAGRLRGAALDVFAAEPLPPESPLWDLANVIISPHSASTVEEENDRLVDLFITNLHHYLDGRPLVNVFDYARKY